MITHINVLRKSCLFENWVIENVYPLTSNANFFRLYIAIFSSNVSVSASSGLRILPLESWARILFSSRWICRSFLNAWAKPLLVHIFCSTSAPPSLNLISVQVPVIFWPVFQDSNPHRIYCSYVSLLSLARFYFVCHKCATQPLHNEPPRPYDCYKCFLVSLLISQWLNNIGVVRNCNRTLTFSGFLSVTASLTGWSRSTYLANSLPSFFEEVYNSFLIAGDRSAKYRYRPDRFVW